MRLRLGIAFVVALAAVVLFAIGAGSASAGSVIPTTPPDIGAPLQPPCTDVPTPPGCVAPEENLTAYAANPSGPPVVCNHDIVKAIDGKDDCEPDPQATNVPWLAWRGEEVRIAKCIAIPEARPGALAVLLAQLGGNVLAGNFTLERWSGVHDGDRPRFEGPDATEEQATAYPFEGGIEGQPAICWAAHVVSGESGLAMIKLSVDLSNFRAFPISFADAQAVKSSMLVGWMSLNKPELCEINAGGDRVPVDADHPEIDRLSCGGSGDFVAHSEPGEVRVLVTGSLTLQQSFGRDVIAGTGGLIPAPAQSIELPRDWAALAVSLARSPDLGGNPSPTTPNRERDPKLWDIHDRGPVDYDTPDPINNEGHVPGVCAPVKPALIDAVDNCTGALSGNAFSFTELTPMSRYYGDTTYPLTEGPYDPLRPDTSLLTDGQLNASDAPMPPARIDVSIANGGFGSLRPSVDKEEVYSRDGTDSTAAHNQYAPYSNSCIPARACEYNLPFLALAGPTASTQGVPHQWTSTGSDSAFINNNFLGYKTFGFDPVNGLHDLGRPSIFGMYDYWDTETLVEQVATDTNCLLRRGPDTDKYGKLIPHYRQTPEGPQTVLGYSDEHGEFRVGFTPGTGADFDAINPTPNNSNGGCDLQGINPLATAKISAIARYPYQPTGAPDVASANTLTKRLLSKFDKFVQCFPKGDGSDEKEICVAHAQDIDGSPFVGEEVCLTGPDGSAVDTFSGTIHDVGNFPGSVKGAGSHSTHRDLTVTTDATRGEGIDVRQCGLTDSKGNAAFEIFTATTPGAAALAQVLFVDEGINRCIAFVFGQLSAPSRSVSCKAAAGTGGTTGASTGSSTGGGSGGSTTGSGSATTGGTGSVTSVDNGVKPHVKVAPKLGYAKIVLTKKGRYLVFLVKGEKNGTAKVKISLVGKGNKVVGTVVKTVRTNHVVRMRLAKLARTVRLSVSS